MEIACTLAQAPYESVCYNHVRCLHCVSNCGSEVARGYDLDSVRMVECASSRVWTVRSCKDGDHKLHSLTSDVSHLALTAVTSYFYSQPAGSASDSYFHG